MRRFVVVLLAIAAVLVAAPADARPAAVEQRAALGRLSIPAIGVNAGIIPVGVTRNGHLAIGRSVRDVYRWKHGVLPGQQGSAVLAGHTWSKGPGVFDKLGRLRPGNVVVVGNPCNTNCMIAARQARRLPRSRFTAMTRLDQNRAATQLAQKAQRPVTEVSEIIIYGNHSPTMFPDFFNARIGGKPAPEVIKDEAWLRETFIPAVGKRGAAIIEARGVSSACTRATATARCSFSSLPRSSSRRRLQTSPGTRASSCSR